MSSLQDDSRCRPVTPGLADIIVRPRRRPWLPRVARALAIIGLPIALTLLAYRSAWNNLLTGWGAAGLMIWMPLASLLVVFLILQFLTIRRWRSIAGAANAGTLPEMLAQIVADPRRPETGLWAAVCTVASARAGDAECRQTIRIARAGRLVPIEPIAELREPHPLQEQVGGAAWGLPAVLGIIFLLTTLAGNPGWQQFLVGGLFLGSLLLTGWAHFGGFREWWLVPGGLVRRVPAGASATLQMATPANANLVAVASGAFWQVRVTSRAFGTWRMVLNQAEHKALLAAWLSPLPPPTDEQLAELGA